MRGSTSLAAWTTGSRSPERSVTGLVSQARLDEAVTRIMQLKFDLGLFETPYVDPARAARIAGSPLNQREATLAVLRIKAPFQRLHPTFFFGSSQHEGDLDFKDDDSTFALVRATAARVPTIVVVYLDRPAILTSLVPLTRTLIADFGASDVALLNVLTGRVRAIGRLPFELPRSMDAVRAQKPDVPHDSPSPLYPIGYRWSASRMH